jgi:hypothetical protein
MPPIEAPPMAGPRAAAAESRRRRGAEPPPLKAPPMKAPPKSGPVALHGYGVMPDISRKAGSPPPKFGPPQGAWPPHWVRPFSDFWISVMMAPVGDHPFDRRQYIVLEDHPYVTPVSRLVMKEYLALLLRESPFGPTQCVAKAHSGAASKASGVQPEFITDLGDNEQNIQWMMEMMLETMPHAHHQVVYTSTLPGYESFNLRQATMKLPLFVRAVNDHVTDTHFHQRLAFHCTEDCSVIDLEILTLDDSETDDADDDGSASSQANAGALQ